jgi:LemA protein
MRMRSLAGIVILVIVLGLLGCGALGCSAYNQLVGLEEQVNAAWGQVDNVYQRRADLVPNLVETVKGAANFERQTLTAVIEARAKATQVQATLGTDVIEDPQAFARFQKAQGELGGALSRLLVTVEQYPELKANQNFLALQAQLEGTENRIAVERRNYNDVARGFNTRIRQFPQNLVASLGHMQKKQYFEAQQGAEQAPKVQF